MEQLVRWMDRTAGRALRAGAGLALLVGGAVLGGATGIALAPMGHLPLRMGSH